MADRNNEAPKKEPRKITLYGRVFITGKIEAVTGLHIGGGKPELAIGALDNVVVRNALSNEPYIPGSSLRGKMRSLLEKHYGKCQNRDISKTVYIHMCEDEAPYKTCEVCRVFGVSGEFTWAWPSRLQVRDVPLSPATKTAMADRDPELAAIMTETKWEASIDRVTSAAVPRQVERVPAGSIFGPMEFSYCLYKHEDLDLLSELLLAMKLLETDYLGGLGSRGSGQVRFQGLSVRAYWRTAEGTLKEEPWPEAPAQPMTVAQIREKLGKASAPGTRSEEEDTLLGWLSHCVHIPE